MRSLVKLVTPLKGSGSGASKKKHRKSSCQASRPRGCWKNCRQGAKRIRKAQEKLDDIQALIEKSDDIKVTAKIYNMWATDYDRDMLTLHYRAPEYVASVLKYELGIGLDAKILDLGCGTGLLGKELKQLQYANVHGVDIAHDMIDRAQQKDCYNSCRLVEGLKCIDETFDVVVICSAFGKGQIYVDSVDHLMNLVAANGHMVVAQLSPREAFEDKALQEFVELLAIRLGAAAAQINPIEGYISGRLGLIGVVGH